MANAGRDNNQVTTLLALSSADGVTLVPLKADPATGRLLVDLSGGVTGPGTSTDNAIARFDGTGGATLQNSGVIIDNSNNVTGVATLNKITITQPATGSTLTIEDGFTLTVTANASIAGTHTGASSGTNTGDQTNITGNAGTVTNATLTTALTVNTGTLTFIANAANNSVVTIGAGASSLSGANTGDQTTVSGNAGTVTVADAGGDTTTFVLLGTAATGSLAPATDSGLTYNATSGVLTATGFAGPLTGDVTGNVSGSAGTVTGFTAGANILTGPALAGVSATLANAETLTNKRITSRVLTFASDATPDVNSDLYDAVTITAQAAAITDVNVTGTPTNFQKLIFRLKDNATARAITWGSDFEARGVALPTTTTISKVLTVGFIYDTVTSKWGCVAVADEV